MNEIKLPPLPHLPLNDLTAAYKAVHDYGQQCATTAIEADRKRNYAATQPQQIPEGYRLQPISEFDATMDTRTIPEGYKLVPIEPTSKQVCLMALEIQGANEKGVFRTDDSRWPESVAKAEAAYKAMLEAAPKVTS